MNNQVNIHLQAVYKKVVKIYKFQNKAVNK